MYFGLNCSFTNRIRRLSIVKYCRMGCDFAARGHRGVCSGRFVSWQTSRIFNVFFLGDRNTATCTHGFPLHAKKQKQQHYPRREQSVLNHFIK